jgi:site-specific DNA-methyltransferase (adenine-specific)
MQWVKLSAVKANPNNPRVIRDEKFAKLKQSIIDFPEMLEKRPLVCYTEGDKYIVLGGNMRLKALSDIGAKEIPIILADEWTEEQRAQFLIKDNVGFGEWDWNTLANEWDADKLTEWGLDLPPMDAIELEAEEDDYQMPDELQTDIVLGDLFEIGEHRLLCGDSTDSDSVAKLMDGKKADMVFTDPPYGMFLDTDYSKIKGSENSIGFKGNKTGNKYDKIIGDNEDFTPQLINTIFASFPKTKEIFIWGADYFVDLLPNYGKDGSWLVWNKRSSEAQQRGIGNCFELCWSLNKHKRFVLDFEWFGFLSKDDPNEARNRQHPSMKPSKLISRMINEFCKDANIIVDIFLGSGTTMVASHQLKRKCYGMELDPKYCQVIVDRMIKLDPTLEIKRNGQTYNRQTTDGQ